MEHYNSYAPIVQESFTFFVDGIVVGMYYFAITTGVKMTELTHVNTQKPTMISKADESLKLWELQQRKAKAFAASQLVPREYQGNVANTVIAMSIADRIGADPLMVMQSLHIIHGRPSWSSKFIIGALNACGRFTELEFAMDGEGESRSCTVKTTSKATGKDIVGPTVSMKLAKDEGWIDK